MKRIRPYWILGVLMLATVLWPCFSNSGQMILVEADFDDLTTGTIDTNNVSSPTLDELNADTIGATWDLYDTNVWSHSISSDGGGQGDKAYRFQYISGTRDYAARLELDSGILVSDISRNPLLISFETITGSDSIGGEVDYYLRDGTTQLLRINWYGDSGRKTTLYDKNGSQTIETGHWANTATWNSTDANIVSLTMDIYDTGAVTGRWNGVTFSGEIDTAATINRFELTTKESCFMNNIRFSIPEPVSTVIIVK